VFRLLDAAVPDGCEVLFAPFDWVLWEGADLEVRQPDAIVTRSIEDDTIRGLHHPPLLAVEVLSPTSNERDLVTKRRSYARAGLEHYWVIDPETPQVGIFRREGDELVLVQHATGATRLTVTEPLHAGFAPTDLLR
jgi:Uma2 family endonuclease